MARRIARRNRPARLAAESRLLGEGDGDAADAAHLVVPRSDLQADAQLLVHAPLQVTQVVQVLQVLQALQ